MLICLTFLRLGDYIDTAPDLDGGGAWGPGVVEGPTCGYKMLR